MLLDVILFFVQCAALFIASSVIFDAVHYLLHRWQRSRFGLLRMFSSWHQVHHDFLDKNMDVHPALAWKNFYAHLLPEYATSMAGTMVFIVWVDWLVVFAILLLHTGLLFARIVEEGMDFHHMSADRISGQRGAIAVGPSFHAMHHINPRSHYSSVVNVFDMVFGTALAISGKKVLLTGATGAYGSQMYAALTKLGAKVETLSVTDITVSVIEGMHLEEYDFLVMCHGLKKSDQPWEVWRANHAVTTALGDAFIQSNLKDLVPPEIWCVGSEAEMIGYDDYAMSKRYMANYAAQNWFYSPDVTYRHIVPSAFSSRMGKGLMSAKTAVWWSLFLIRRGFRYIPVTYTGLAFLNRLRFATWRKRPPRTV